MSQTGSKRKDRTHDPDNELQQEFPLSKKRRVILEFLSDMVDQAEPGSKKGVSVPRIDIKFDRS